MSSHNVQIDKVRYCRVPMKHGNIAMESLYVQFSCVEFARFIGHPMCASKVKQPVSNEASNLIENALEHCIFPLVRPEDVRRDGPILIKEGSGANVVDIHGDVYLDMMGSHSRANSLGYGNEEIARAMYDQAKRMHQVGSANYMSEPTARLATKIASLAPGSLSKLLFVTGGSEAVETALKIAKQYQQAGPKPRAYKVIARWNAYHGSTMGALSATDWLSVREVFDPRLPGYSFVPSPSCYRNPYGIESDEEYAELCAKHLESHIQHEDPDLVAAFIGEPIMQANGVNIPPKSYWSRVREICSRYGVVMIVDEIITGFGRTGYWFASEHFGMVPDIITMGKALSAGYAPLSAAICRPEIADGIPQFKHVNTFNNHPVCCAAANAVIHIIERDGLIGRAKENGVYFQKALQDALGSHPIVGEVRGLGHWHAVDFTADKRTRAPFKDDTVRAVVHRMRDLGVVAGAIGTALEMAPPLIISKAELDRAASTCARAVSEIARERGLA
jgi:putrescine---pyruvate transaminase